MQHTATHCNTLHHTASHCITLHHTATPRNTLQHSCFSQTWTPSLRSWISATRWMTSSNFSFACFKKQSRSCETTLSYLWHDSFMCNTTHSESSKSEIAQANMNYLTLHIWIISHVWIGCVHICVSQLCAHMGKSCHIHAWVTSYVGMKRLRKHLKPYMSLCLFCFAKHIKYIWNIYTHNVRCSILKYAAVCCRCCRHVAACVAICSISVALWAAGMPSRLHRNRTCVAVCCSVL